MMREHWERALPRPACTCRRMHVALPRQLAGWGKGICAPSRGHHGMMPSQS